jgi:hypothetical protein
VAATKIHFEELALEADTKQSRQAGKTVEPDWFVLCPLLVLALSGEFLPTNIP